MRLIECSFNYSVYGRLGFELLADLVQRSDCYDFTYSRLDEAAEVFAQLAEPNAAQGHMKALPPDWWVAYALRHIAELPCMAAFPLGSTSVVRLVNQICWHVSAGKSMPSTFPTKYPTPTLCLSPGGNAPGRQRTGR